MPFFLKSCLKLRKSKEKKNKKLNQCIRPFRDTTTPVRIDNAIQHSEPHPGSSNLNPYDEMNNPEHLLANNATVNETSETLEEDLEENDTDDDISGNDFHSQNSEDTETNSELDMCANFRIKISEGTPQRGVFRTDLKQKSRKTEHDVDEESQNSDDSLNKSTNCTQLKKTVSQKKKSQNKKNKKIDQYIEPFSDITTPVINVNAIVHCKTKLRSLNEDNEMLNPEYAVANNTSVDESFENFDKASEEDDTDNDIPFDDFESQNYEDSENNSKRDMCANFRLNDSDGTQEVTVVRTADSKKKKRKNKKNGYDFCDISESQISKDSEKNCQGDLFADIHLNESVGNPKGTVVKTRISSGKKSKNRNKKKDKCNRPFTDFIRNKNAIQKDENKLSSSNLSEDHEMKGSDHSVANSKSNSEKTENSEKTVQEIDTDDIDSCDEINSQNSKYSDNNSQADMHADFHSNDSERTRFNVFEPQKDAFERVAVTETTSDYQDINGLLDAQQAIETITVTKRLEVLVPDDILENIYIEKSCEIIRNITVNSDVVGLIEELNTIDDNIQMLHQKRKLEEPVKFVQDVDVCSTQDKNLDSHKAFSIDSKTSESSFNRERQSPTCSEDTFPSQLKSEEKQILSLNNIITENELEENLYSRESTELESSTSCVNSNIENSETDDDSLTAQIESSKLITVEMAKHRHLGDSDSESGDSKTKSESLEVDTTVKIEKEICDSDFSQVSMKNSERNLPAKEVMINTNSKNDKDKRENIIHPNIEIYKSEETTTKNDTLFRNIVEYAPVNNDKFRNSKEEAHCENGFENFDGTNNTFFHTEANFKVNNFQNVTHNADNSNQSIVSDVTVQLESKSAIRHEEKFATETAKSQTALSAHLKEVIDLSVYQASEPINSEMFSDNKVIISTEETRAVLDTRTDHIPEKYAQIIFLIPSDTKSDEFPIYKILEKPIECDNIISHAGCSEGDWKLIEMRNSVISSNSEANNSSIPQIQKINSEKNPSDDIFKDTNNTNDLFKAQGQEDSSEKYDGISNFKNKNKEIFTCSIVNECKQKEKLDSILQPSKNEANFMNTNKNLKDYQCKTSQNAEKNIFESNIEKVATQSLDEYDTRKKGGFISISSKSAGDVSVSDIEDLQKCETLLHNFHDKSCMLGKQRENTILENKIFDESQENASYIIEFDENDRNEIYINDTKYSEALSDNFKDSSEKKMKKPLLTNFQNSYSIQDTQRDNSSLTEKTNKMLQNSADSLFVNVESNQENHFLSEDSLERISTIQKSHETISPYSSQEYIKSHTQNSSLTYFNENDTRMISPQCGVSKQHKPDNSRIELNNPIKKEKHTNNAISYRNKTSVCKHSLTDLDDGNAPYLVKEGTIGNLQNKTPEFNILEEEITNKISSDMLQKDNTYLAYENSHRMKSASKCSLLESDIFGESSTSKREDVKNQALKSESIESYIRARREHSADEQTLPDKFETLLNFNRNRRHSERRTKLKNTFTIQKERCSKKQSLQKFEIRNTKIRLQKSKDETVKNSVLHNSKKLTKIYTNLPTNKYVIKNNSPNIKIFSRSRNDRTSSIHEKSSPMENKKMQPSNSVQTDSLHEVKIESFKEYSIPMTPVRRKILDSSRSIRSPKYPSPLKSKRTDKKESYPLKQIFLKSTKQKDVRHIMFDEKNIHKLKNEQEIYNQDSGNIKATSPRKRATEDGNRHQIHHTQNYRATSPNDLKSKFDDVFKEYAGKGRCNRHLISFQRSTKLLQDAGVIGKMLTAEEAADAFKCFAGVKVALNKEDYRKFLMKLTRKKRLNYNEVYEKLCHISDREIVLKNEFF